WRGTDVRERIARYERQCRIFCGRKDPCVARFDDLRNSHAICVGPLRCCQEDLVARADVLEPPTERIAMTGHRHIPCTSWNRRHRATSGRMQAARQMYNAEPVSSFLS